jgi:hypothetical protein
LGRCADGEHANAKSEDLAAEVGSFKEAEVGGPEDGDIKDRQEDQSVDVDFDVAAQHAEEVHSLARSNGCA